MTGFLTRNWGLKLLSLAMAYMVWNAVSSRENVTRQLEIPIVFEESEELRIISYEPQNVRLRVIGAEDRLKNLIDTVTVTYDATGAQPGEHNVQLLPDDVRGIPTGVSFELIDTRLTFDLEGVREKQVGVRPILAGEPAPGFEIRGVTKKPPGVNASGPDSVIQALTDAQTEVIDIGGARSTITRNVRLRPPTSSALFSPGNVEITVEIGEQVDTRSMEIPITVPEGWVAEPAVVTVKVTAVLSTWDVMERQVSASVENDSAPSDAREWTGTVSINWGGLNDHPDFRIEEISTFDAVVRRNPSQP